MTEWDDQAIILRIGQFRERDLWLKTLCREHGSLTLFAFGGVASKRRFCGCLDIFNSLQCRIKNSRNGMYCNLQEASLLGGPRILRREWRRMGIAANCLRFMEAFQVTRESASECFLILEDLRDCLELGAHETCLLPIFFRFRIASALGFAPDLHICSICGDKPGARAVFLPEAGRIICERCAAKSHASSSGSMELSLEALEFMRKVLKDLPSKWDMSSLSSGAAKACCRSIDNFVQYQIGLAWENGEFRNV